MRGVAERFGAARSDPELIGTFATTYGLTLVESSIARRSVRLSGTARQMSAAFGVQLGVYQTPARTYRGREGEVHVPAALAAIVEGGSGLDDRRMARLGFVRPAKASQDVAPRASCGVAQEGTTMRPAKRQAARMSVTPLPARRPGGP